MFEFENNSYNNEEDLKVKFLVPLLESLGVSIDDLKFEKSYKLKIGRSHEEIDNKGAWKSKSPRVDILVKVKNRNAFIIEVKGEDLDLTNDDRDQACSYAMLTIPRVPYALLTNGKESKLYRAYDLKEVLPDELNFTNDYAAVLPSITDFDALSCFLRLSKNNLNKFCVQQVSDNMDALKGSVDNLYKKYIPELHMQNKELSENVSKFLSSDRSVLAIVGDSGIGKTCSVCFETERYLSDGKPALFFRGSELGASLKEAISDQFSWVFSENINQNQLIKKISKLSAYAPIFVVIDAIDEWEEPSRYQQISAFSNQVRNENIKLIVSCKSIVWKSFLERSGTATDLYRNLFNIGDDRQYTLKPPTRFEQAWMFDKYKEVFEFQGEWNPQLLDEASTNPLLMRLAFEVAKFGNLSSLKKNALDVYESYLDTVCTKIDGAGMDVEELLTILCEFIYKSSTRSVLTKDFRVELGLSAVDLLPIELFTYGVLEELSIDREKRIRFVFEGLQNYITVYKYLKWDKASLTDLSKDVVRPWSELKRDAITFFYDFTGSEHKRIIDSSIYDSGLNFISTYRALVADNFSAISNRFPNGHPDKVGFVVGADLETGKAFGYGLRKIAANDDPVLIVPTTSVEQYDLSRTRAKDIGFRFSHSSIFDADPHIELADFHLQLMLKEIIEEGQLNEENSPELSYELLNAAVNSELNCFKNSSFLKPENMGEIEISELDKQVKLEQYRARFKRDETDRMLKTGELEHEKNEGGSISYSGPVFSLEQTAEIERKCLEALETGGDNRLEMIPIDSVSRSIKLAIKQLGGKGNLKPSLSFAHGLSYSYFQQPQSPEFTELCIQFLSSFFENYKSLIEKNFPTLKGHFELYLNMPVICKVQVYPSRTRLSDSGIDVLIYSAKKNQLKENDVSYERNIKSMRIRGEAVIDGVECSFYRGLGMGTDGLFKSNMLVMRTHFPDIGQKPFSTALRDFTYSWIYKEFKSLSENGLVDKLVHSTGGD